MYGQQGRRESPVWPAQAGPAGLSLKNPRLGDSRTTLESGSVQGVTGEAQLQHSSLQESLGWQLRRGELQRDAQGWKGTGRGWLISVTPSSQARLGGRAWSCPGAGAEKPFPAPGMGLLHSLPAGWRLRLGLPWLLALTDTESPGPGHGV